MGVHHVTVTTLVIGSGATESNALISSRDYRDADSLIIMAPAALTGVVTIQVANNENPIAADWRDYSPGNTDLTIGAGNAVAIEVPAFKALRLKSSLAEAAQRDFPVNKAISTL